MNYSDKLRDPRWQKKRLEVLERAGWKCQACGDAENTLEIHHLQYGKGEPWDVPDKWLECLCSECHEWRTDFNRLIGEKSSVCTIACKAWMWVLRPILCGDNALLKVKGATFSRILDGMKDRVNSACENGEIDLGSGLPYTEQFPSNGPFPGDDLTPPSA